MTRPPTAEPDVRPDSFLVDPAQVRFSDGFYDEERNGAERFRWMSQRGALEFEPGSTERFLEFWVLSEFHDLSQELAVSNDAEARRYPLVAGWGPLSIQVPAGASSVTLAANKLFPAEYYPADRRTLAVRLRDVRLHHDLDRHAAIVGQYANSRLNQQELLAGRTELASTPPSLGIDLHGACNVKPPCVYCEWDFSKKLEGEHVSVPFTRETLREWGAFFDNSATLINCSIGEPFMMRNLDELLDVFGRTGKALQMTTNGQILTDRNIQKLLGHPIDLYVSLDAATAETYAKLRNNTFDRLVTNLRRLIAAKGGRGRMPFVHLVFMPMRCNLHELEDFVRLAAELDADRLVLRPLNFSVGTALVWERGGYQFDYQKELLPFDELVRASGRAARLCRRLGLELADQMDFGGSMRDLFRGDFDADAASGDASPAHADTTAAQVRTDETGGSAADGGETALESGPVPTPAPAAVELALPSLGGERQPACLEPWKSLYILRRGVLPCCYGGEPLAPMEEYRAVWNSPQLQSIRRELLHGRFHGYCLRSPACPIVRKMDKARLLPRQQRLALYVEHAWTGFNRRVRFWPNRFFFFPLKRTALRAHRAMTQPGYIKKHSRRLWARLRDRLFTS